MREQVEEKILKKLEDKEENYLIGKIEYPDFERNKKEWAKILAYIYNQKCTSVSKVSLSKMVMDNSFLRKYLKKKNLKRENTIGINFPMVSYFRPLIQVYYNIDISSKWTEGCRIYGYTWTSDWRYGSSYSVENILTRLATELAS